jgi:hypothetical protein
VEVCAISGGSKVPTFWSVLSLTCGVQTICHYFLICSLILTFTVRESGARTVRSCLSSSTLFTIAITARNMSKITKTDTVSSRFRTTSSRCHQECGLRRDGTMARLCQRSKFSITKITEVKMQAHLAEIVRSLGLTGGASDNTVPGEHRQTSAEGKKGPDKIPMDSLIFGVFRDGTSRTHWRFMFAVPM